jgi:hypothetical protein
MCGCVYRERGCVLSSYASSYVNTTMTEALNAKRNLIHERVSRVIVVPLETYLYGMSPEGCLFCGVVSRRRFVLWNGLQNEFVLWRVFEEVF